MKRVQADDEFAVSFEQFSARRDGRTLDVKDCTIWRFRDGQIVEVTLLTTNPYARDAFWS